MDVYELWNEDGKNRKRGETYAGHLSPSFSKRPSSSLGEEQDVWEKVECYTCHLSVGEVEAGNLTFST